jgi:TPR repeat protein
MRKLLGIICFSFVFSVVAHAESCDDGITANAEGDFAKAVAILQPLATKGDDCAQFHLGMMYLFGEGVEKDKVRARGLFEQSAGKGNRAAKVQFDKLLKNP